MIFLTQPSLADLQSQVLVIGSREEKEEKKEEKEEEEKKLQIAIRCRWDLFD